MNDQSENQTTAKARGRSPFAIAAVVLGALAVLLVYGLAAWLYRFDMSSSLAIVQMMVRDIIHGGARPAFVYGQPAIGALEPLANALTFRCFGGTTTALQIGTLLFSLAALFFTSRMAHRVGGAWGVAAALAFCAFAPVEFLHASTVPQGGAGVLIFCTAALLDLGAWLITDTRTKQSQRKSPYSVPLVFALAFLSGIGFWSNGLVVPAIAAVGIAILVFAPRLFRRPLFWIAGLVGFLLGSAPFWVWNFRNGMTSFRAVAPLITLDGVSVVRNASALFSERWPALFNVTQSAPFWRTLVLLASVIPILAVFSLLPFPRKRFARQRSFREPLPDGAKVQLGLLLVYLILFALARIGLALAPTDASRYLLPVIPVLAVLFGTACTGHCSRPMQIASILALVVLIGWQACGFATALGKRPADVRRHEQAQQVVEMLRDGQQKTAFAPTEFYACNVIGNDGAVVFSDPLHEPLPRFREALERDDSPAVLNDCHKAAIWAKASGGTLRETDLDGIRIATDIVPPSTAVHEVPASRWRAATNARGHELTSTLTDRSMRQPVHLGKQDVFTIDLKETTPLCGIRLFAQSAPFLEGFSLYGRSSTNAPYRPLTPMIPDTGSAWSGPRFYQYQGPFPREARFATEELESLQIRFSTTPETPCGELFDLQLLSPTTNATSTLREALPSLVALLRRQGVQRLYASRWTAHQISAATHGAIRTNWDESDTDDPASTAITLDIFTAVLMDEAGILSLREAFRSHGFLMREIPIPPFGALFIPESNQRIPLGPRTPTGVVFCENYALNFPDYDWLRQALDALPQPIPGKALEDLYEREPEAIPLLQAFLSTTSDEKTGTRIWNERQALTRPTIGAGFPASFKGDITWHGARIIDNSMTRDAQDRPEAIVIRSFWSAPLSASGNAVDLVYTLFTSDAEGNRISSRHAFPLANLTTDSINEHGEKCWHTDSFLPLPGTPSDHVWSLSIALQDKAFPFRLRSVKTDLPTRRNGVILNDAVFFSQAPSF